MLRNTTLRKALKLAAVQAAPVLGWNALLSDADPLSTSLYLSLFNNAVEIPGPETDALQQACEEANITAVVGVTERLPNTTGTLFNTQIFIGSDGSLLHKHQKLVPTVGERLIHAPGTTGPRSSVQTNEFGGLNGLICAENGNMLSPYAVATEYPVVHVAPWPQFLSYDVDVSNLIDVASKAVAHSVGTYVINSAAVVSDDEFEVYGVDEKIRGLLSDNATTYCRQTSTTMALRLQDDLRLIDGPKNKQHYSLRYPIQKTSLFGQVRVLQERFSSRRIAYFGIEDMVRILSHQYMRVHRG